VNTAADARTFDAAEEFLTNFGMVRARADEQRL